MVKKSCYTTMTLAVRCLVFIQNCPFAFASWYTGGYSYGGLHLSTIPNVGSLCPIGSQRDDKSLSSFSVKDKRGFEGVVAPYLLARGFRITRNTHDFY